MKNINNPTELKDSSSSSMMWKTSNFPKPADTYWKRTGKNNLLPLLFKSNLNESEKKTVFSEFVDFINIETNSTCNRTCNYCPLSINKRTSESDGISVEYLKKIRNELSEIDFSGKISFNLYNEPLSDSNLSDIIKEFRISCPNAFLQFNSNGDFANIKIIKKLEEAGLNYIGITRHAENLNNLDLKKSIKLLKEKARKIGLIGDPIQEFQTDEFNLTWEYKVGSLTIHLMIHLWQIKGQDRAGFVSDMSDNEYVRYESCVRPFRTFSITSKLNILPCCQLFEESPEFEVYGWGNILESKKTIFDYYCSDGAVKMRKSLIDAETPKTGICRSCSGLSPNLDKETSLRMQSVI